MNELFQIAALMATGYGEVEGGQPTWEQREMIVYTNFVRVDPTHWTSAYDCNLSTFSSSEKQPIDPVLYHDGLTAIAQLHTEEMNQYDFLAHESRDGTDFGTRVWPYYDGTTIGENVAMGYSDNWAAVFEGWMCSAGHRSNIMESDFEDIGTGVDGRYYTQDFGGGLSRADQPVAMGVHTPKRPSSDVEFLATWKDSSGPGTLWVETDTDCIEMSLEAGTESRGAWSATVDAGSGCQAYRFVWADGDDYESLPTEGAYQYGSGCTEWISAAPETCIPDAGDDGGSRDDGSSDDSDSDSDTDDSGDVDLSGGQDCPEIDRNNDCEPDELQGESSSGFGCSAPASQPRGLWLLGLPLLALRRRP
jgi:hypothetical protein